jgi:hypothetical protein
LATHELRFILMRRTTAFFLSALLPLTLIAGSNEKRATAVRTSAAPLIDGVLRDPSWSSAQPVTDFTQSEPMEGMAPSQPTQIRILYDDDALYFGCMMYDSSPERIGRRLARRDEEIEADYISIRIDSYHDHQTAYEFTISAAGVKVDVLQFNDATEEDESWDVVWEGKTAVTDSGWSAEIRIPFAVLRFPPAEQQEWGIQFIRTIERLRERDMWALILKRESGVVSRFGHLQGITGISPRTSVEVLPYVVGNARTLAAPVGLQESPDYAASVGLDLKFKPSSEWAIDATFNPDFGQVEADPAVLNLTTFETFYPERRPFFVEGSQILRFTTFGGDFGPGLYYSRRVGKALSVEAPEGGYVLEDPRFATILGAAKISGKMSNGISIGVLEAVTREEHAVVVDSLGNQEKVLVEPLSNYGLVRLRKDVLENSNVGMIATAVSQQGRLPAVTGGLDWNIKFANNEYRIDGFLAGSRTATGREQREDGTAGKAGFYKDGGEHWRWSMTGDFTSRKFYINDMGYFRRPNDHGVVAELIFKDDRVTSWRNYWDVEARLHRRWNFDKAELNNSAEIGGIFRTSEYWELNAGFGIDAGDYDDRETRGNGLYRKPEQRSLEIGLESDPRQIVVGEVRGQLADDTRQARFLGVVLELLVKASSTITFTFEASRENIDREFAWVTNVEDLSRPTGIASIFAERSTDQWDLTTRGSFVFATDLTLEFYLQLFFAKGRYQNLQRMLDESTFVPDPYVQPDFNEVSLNSNLVLRWEYLPGSTLYLVWSQGRQGAEGTFDSSFRDNLRYMSRLPAENVLLLKISYWFTI